MTSIVTNDSRNNLIDLLNSDIKTSNSYYFFIGDCVSQNSPTILLDYPKDTLIDCYHNMIMGKRITANNTMPVIRNIPYTSNKVYELYDDSDKFLQEKDYYVIVDENAYSHVYKVLDNNFNSNSTVQPTFSDITGANTNFYRTSDGYLWKYMYSVSDSDVTKFGTTDFFPVSSNTTVLNSAIPGAIDFIEVNKQGSGYNNYLYDTFAGADIAINGNTQVYAITNSVSSSLNGFYTDSLIYLSEGTGQGQYRTIIDYFLSNSGRYIVLDSAFKIKPTNGTKYQITPKVNIYGSGSQTINAAARALINAYSSNSVYRVELLERGENYTYITANVTAANVVSVIEKSELRPIYSPSKGHGYDPVKELNCNHLCINTTLNSNTITINTASFAQIGILKTPKFNSARIKFSNNYGTFISGENIFKIKPLQISPRANVSLTSVTITSNTSDFINQVVVGDVIYLKSNTDNQLAVVNSVINSTAISIQSNGYFSSNSTIIYLANKSAKSVCNSMVNSTSVDLRSIEVGYITGDLLIGESSGAIGYVNSISISNQTKNFDTYIGLYKYECSIVTGTFTANEIVSLGNTAQSNAILHSTITNGSNVTIYAANQVGSFDIGSSIIGSNSSAVAIIQNKYLPEIIFGSGDVIYLENIEPKTRSNNDTETFKTIFEF